MKFPETARRLQEAMNDMGITQQDLVDKSGVSKSSISQYVNGSHAPSNISSGKMAQVLKVSAVWLMGLSDKKYDDRFVPKYDKRMVELTMKFSKLDEIDKEIIMNLLDSLYMKTKSSVQDHLE